jgi:hypothetical protein
VVDLQGYARCASLITGKGKGVAEEDGGGNGFIPLSENPRSATVSSCPHDQDVYLRAGRASCGNENNVICMQVGTY